MKADFWRTREHFIILFTRCNSIVYKLPTNLPLESVLSSSPCLALNNAEQIDIQIQILGKRLRTTFI